jgi:hypothetical protein
MGIDRILDLVEAATAVVKARNDRKKFWLTVLGIICGIAAVSAIAYGIYRFLTPDYFDDYDDDDDFDDDDFDDDFEDDFEDDEEVAGAEA